MQGSSERDALTAVPSTAPITLTLDCPTVTLPAGDAAMDVPTTTTESSVTKPAAPTAVMEPSWTLQHQNAVNRPEIVTTTALTDTTSARVMLLANPRASMELVTS